MVSSSGQVKIMDFGIAHNIIKQGGARNYMVSNFAGTAKYIAPEVWALRYNSGVPVTSVDVLQADVWSLGVVLFFMVFGFPPFESSVTVTHYTHRITVAGRAKEYQDQEEHSSSGSADVVQFLISQSETYGMNPGMVGVCQVEAKSKLSAMQHFPLGEKVLELLNKLLVFDPTKRITLQEIGEHSLLSLE